MAETVRLDYNFLCEGEHQFDLKLDLVDDSPHRFKHETEARQDGVSIESGSWYATTDPPVHMVYSEKLMMTGSDLTIDLSDLPGPMGTRQSFVGKNYRIQAYKFAVDDTNAGGITITPGTYPIFGVGGGAQVIGAANQAQIIQSVAPNVLPEILELLADTITFNGLNGDELQILMFAG